MKKMFTTKWSFVWNFLFAVERSDLVDGGQRWGQAAMYAQNLSFDSLNDWKSVHVYEWMSVCVCVCVCVCVSVCVWEREKETEREIS